MTTGKQQANNKARIAFYGGAFDPVHRAHLEVARAAHSQVSLDRVVFIPAAQSPLKAHGPVASDAERLEMLKLATAGQSGFSVDDSELKRGGISYTIQTVQDCKGREPEAELFWIIGGDQLSKLDKWHAIEELVHLVTFLVLARPGYGLSAPEISGLRWKKIEAPLMEESSTQIRERISKHQSVEGLLPRSVEAFIREKSLYTYKSTSMSDTSNSIRKKTLEEIHCAVAAIKDKKGESVKILDVRGKSSITDYMILVTATSEPHAKALKSALDANLKEAGVQLIGQDREVGSGWLVIDAFDFMVHLQTEEMREYYKLDQLWSDAAALSL